MSSSFWNPFRPNRHYFDRTYLECIRDFVGMLSGDYHAGLLDYPLFPCLLLKWMDDKNLTRYDGRLYTVVDAFLVFFFVIKLIIILPLTIVSLPLIFLYNELFLYIGRPLNKICNELEVLPFKEYKCADRGPLLTEYDGYDKISLDYDIFNHAFYQETKNSARFVDIHKPHPNASPGLISRRIKIKPLFIDVPPEKRILVLGLYDVKLLSFIVPSKANSPLLRPLIENHLINFDHSSDLYTPKILAFLNKALEEEDPFILSSSQWRVETTDFLLKSMCPDDKSRKQQGNGALDICSIITDYASFSNLNNGKLRRTQKKEADEQASDSSNNNEQTLSTRCVFH